jgi:hypothetical protein
MAHKTPMPTAEFINAGLEQLEKVWTPTHGVWNEVDDFYHRTFKVWTGDEAILDRPSYHTSRATNLVDHAADTQLAFNPEVHREPLGDSQEAKDAADRVEYALRAIMADSALFESNLTFKQLGRYLIHYGYAIPEGPMWVDQDMAKPRQKTEEDDNDFKARRREYEDAQRGYNPFRIRAVHPSTVLLDPAEKIPKFSIMRSQRYAKDIEALSATKSNRSIYNRFTVAESDYGPFDLVDLVVYTDEYWVAAKLGNSDDLLYAEMNPWGFVPHVQAFSGFGQQRMGGGATGSGASSTAVGGVLDPKYMAVGLLNPVMDSIRAETQHVSARHHSVMRAAFAKLIAEDAAAASQQMKGEVLEGRPEDIAYLRYPDFPRWMDRNGDEIAGDIERGTYDPVLAGRRQAGINTVGQQVIQSGASQRKFAAPAQQLNHIATIIGQNILKMVWRRKITIYVDGTELRPADIKGNFNAQVTFEVIDQVINLQLREIGMQEVREGLKSPETYIEEDRKVANVSEEMKRIDDAKARQNPIVSKVLDAKSVRAAGFPEAADVLEAVAAAELEELEASLPNAPNAVAAGANGATELTGRTNTGLTDAGTPAEAVRAVRQPLGPDRLRPNRPSELVG